MDMNGRSVELHIEELVMHGVSRVDALRIARVAEGELSRLIAEGGVPAGWGRGGEVGRVDAGSFEVRSDAGAEITGARLARALYASGSGRARP